MTYDEARDVSREDEIVEAEQIDPEDVMTGDDLDYEQIQALYRETYRDRPEPDFDPDAEALELDRYFDSIRENYIEENYR
jgi:hypothetical protein